MKLHKNIATRAAPFGSDMHQIVCRLGLRPRPPSCFRGGAPGKKEGGMGKEGNPKILKSRVGKPSMRWTNYPHNSLDSLDI